VRPHDELLGRAEEFASSSQLVDFATHYWRDREFRQRFDERPDDAVAEFGLELPEGLDLRPLGFGRLGKPGPDHVPFQIRLSQCVTWVVRDENGLRTTETVCFGLEIIPGEGAGPIG
jgi:hypothetical protein